MSNITLLNCFNSTVEFHDCSRNFINYASFGNMGFFVSNIFVNFVLNQHERAVTHNAMSWFALASALLTANNHQDARIQTFVCLIGSSIAIIPPLVIYAKHL